MEQLVERCAGLDVHQAEITACARIPGEQGRVVEIVQEFGTTTPDLLALLDWLLAMGVTDVAMESTGVFWKSPYYVLEDHFQRVLVVNAAHMSVRGVGGPCHNLREMTPPTGTPLPARQICPLCSRDDLTEVVPLGPGLWRYTCGNVRRHPGGMPWVWEGTATSVVGEEPQGKTEQLGLYEDLPRCLRPGEPFVEYGVVEDRYSKLNPAVYEQLLEDYGHTRLTRNKPYTASTFIAKALAALADRGELMVAWDKATGHWSYNGGISYWALPPGPEDPTARLTYEEFTALEGAPSIEGVEGHAEEPEPPISSDPNRRPEEQSPSRPGGKDQRDRIELPSGLSIPAPLERLRTFSAEYPYYDGVLTGDPFEIEPVDVIVTVSVNSFINTADKVRSVHLAMSQACREPLRRIPPDADLLQADERLLLALRDLLVEAMRSRGVLVASATNILHRKRPRLIPMLDSVVLGHYLSGPERRHLFIRSIEKSSPESAADAAMVALEGFRADLAAGAPRLAEMQKTLSQEGFDLSLVRILEILVWTEAEPRGVYRMGAGAEIPSSPASMCTPVRAGMPGRVAGLGMPTTVGAAFRFAEVEPEGVVRWGDPVEETQAGVYVVSLTGQTESLDGAVAEAPLSAPALQRLLDGTCQRLETTSRRNY